MQVYFESLTSVTAYISTANSESEITTQTTVNSYDFNFTMATTKKYYVVIQA